MPINMFVMTGENHPQYQMVPKKLYVIAMVVFHIIHILLYILLILMNRSNAFCDPI